MRNKLHPFKKITTLFVLSLAFLSFRAIEHSKFGQAHLVDMYAFVNEGLKMKNFLERVTFAKNNLSSFPEDGQKEKPKPENNHAEVKNPAIQDSLTGESVVWINDQASWETYTSTISNLEIIDGLAVPINESQVYGFKSKMFTFEELTKVDHIVFKQSTVWDNWTEVSNVGPSDARDAPILISVQEGEYYFLARLSTTSGYQAWQSSDMVNWDLKGPVTGTGNETGKWATTAEYKDGKFYIYYDATNDDKPTLVIDDDLTDGVIGVEMGTAFDDPTPGSDCSVFRDDADGLFHIIYEDWTPISARNYAWDSPLAGHVSSEDGLTDFVYGEHPPVIDQRTTPTGETGTYQHPQMGTLTYEIHEPEQNAYGDYTTIKVGSQYYIFSDYDPIGESMRTARFTSDSWDKEFELVGSTGSGHPDPTVAFAEGQFYLVTQQDNDQVSPGPWVDGVEARAGVDEDGDGIVDIWTDWQVIKESYDHKLGYARVVDVTPAGIDMSGLPQGYGVQFEFTVDNSIVPDVSPIMSSVSLEFGEVITPLAENVAYLKPTLQSSDYLTGITGSSDNAVDGNTDGLYKNGSVTHTKEKGSTNPWWRVDLGAIYDISDINIFNRTDNCCVNRLSGAKVFIGNSDSTDPADYTEIGILTADLQQELAEIDSNGRYLMIYLEGESKILSLTEVQVYGEILLEPIENIAYLKPTSQSTDYKTGTTGSSDNAVDGNTDGFYTNGSVTHTQKEGSNNPWWRVDLGDTYDISTINIFNRADLSCANVSSCSDRLEGAKVYVGTIDSTDPNDYAEVTSLTADIEQSLSNLSITGRYVMVYHEEDSKIISLAEVQVYGEIANEESDKGPTNVILIMADDLGWGDTGCNGSTYATPSLDAMAANGIQFNRFYSASAVCSPTRASVLTGRNPYRVGIPNANSGRLEADETTLAEVLQANGYNTGIFGKWHLGTLTTTVDDANRGGSGSEDIFSVPWENGFDEAFVTESKVPTYNPMRLNSNLAQPSSFEESNYYGTAYWTTPASGIGEGSRVALDDNLEGDDSRVVMDRVLPFIENAVDNDQAFFSVVWFHTPHKPVVLDEEMEAIYGTQAWNAMTDEERQYGSAITAMDVQIGRLREKLAELGVADDTMIWFTSDNGPEKDTPTYAGPYKERKRSLYEGGVRVPGILEWPGQVTQAKETDVPMVTSDYYPTILDILDIQDTGNKSLDGISMKEAVTGSMNYRGTPIGFKYGTQKSLVNDCYKLYQNGTGDYELYDLLNDGIETNDIAAENTELTEIMATELLNWEAAVNADVAYEFNSIPFCDEGSLSLGEIDLFIWAGQSNAQGWSGHEAEDYPIDTHNLDSLIPFNWTYINNYSSNGWETMGPQAGGDESGHFGQEVSFSRNLKQDGYNPAIFKYTLGGTSIFEDWLTPGEGGYYDDMITDLGEAIEKLEDNGYVVNIKGFVWIQGEADSKNEAAASAYYDKLTSIINNLRAYTGNDALPIILGVDEQNPNVVKNPAIWNAQLAIANEDSKINFTSMLGLEKTDQTHLTPTALVTHGEIIYESMLCLLTNGLSSICDNSEDLVDNSSTLPLGELNNISVSSKLYPNPVDNSFYVELESDTPSQLFMNIYNFQGNLVAKEIFDLTIGTNVVSYDINHLASSTYILLLSSIQEGTIVQQTIIKK